VLIDDSPLTYRLKTEVNTTSKDSGIIPRLATTTSLSDVREECNIRHGAPPDVIYGTIFFGKLTLISEPCYVENGVRFAPTYLLIDPGNLVDCVLLHSTIDPLPSLSGCKARRSGGITGWWSKVQQCESLTRNGLLEKPGIAVISRVSYMLHLWCFDSAGTEAGFDTGVWYVTLILSLRSLSKATITYFTSWVIDHPTEL